MEYYLFIFAIIAVLLVILLFKILKPNQDKQAQRSLDEYKNRKLSNEEIGRLYERYIGYLYEEEGYKVEYNGALNGSADMGRDLIVSATDEVFIIQTKRWANYKVVHEKEIFQLYGSMMHYKFSSYDRNKKIKAVFYTSAKYSDVAREVARVLRVELRNQKLDNSYPMIKCNVRPSGDKFYYLPFDPEYDKVKIEPNKGDFFAQTVHEAVAQGFRRTDNYSNVA